MFLYSLLKSVANAVLKLMSAVIAIAHVLFVSIRSLSVNVMLLECSFHFFVSFVLSLCPVPNSGSHRFQIPVINSGSKCPVPNSGSLSL